MSDTWDEVTRLRNDAEHFARADDMLGAAFCDARASAMAGRLRTEESALREMRDIERELARGG